MLLIFLLKHTFLGTADVHKTFFGVNFDRGCPKLNFLQSLAPTCLNNEPVLILWRHIGDAI